MQKRNIYSHEIDLKKIKIKNAPREEFASRIEKIEYRGYEVEEMSDGRKIVITKPGGKFTFGQIKREDFLVFIFDTLNKSLWLISHKNIYDDLISKSEKDPKETLKIIDALENVYNGIDPEDVLSNTEIKNPIGEEPEALLKAYKWIWGQEDVNYPTGKGRDMSFESIYKLKSELINRRKKS
ncbi:MAG: hypothetical protein SCARUB_04945 [Candidatus Scalindua rubra]|uniref:Uncharacterized protein n=1 Tax=Candidatus Scalindua rubra TaxID=1872076 RepID=A0A1E3X2T1_9BACT|nr:MAG: hypothetical protein SCARUB_04945 [Candidatus Scalindua rubra]